ncbi:sensor histidine kinase [Microbacterium marinilacus]|uniref:histidine kinase n=1 Tax=Microbacterium marinilacus TaxID=415209 RepID=A0ABP7BJS0_9MICO|nr:histidine kinase [Microbacterium marinilacus]MBY0687640.1 hypothetical protein [Microbacterium marinilacus]
MDTDRPTWRSRAWLVAASVLLALVLVLSTVGVDSPQTTLAMTLVAIGVAAAMVVWALLRTRSHRRLYEAELAAWAAERAAQGERLRIARDLHDLVSHGLGIITVRAAVARAIPDPDEDDRANALADIERVGRETTTELRRMLTVLRTPGPAPLRPADTLDDLPAIVDAASSTGVEATLAVADLGEVSAGVQLTVCAVVREALSNAIRHAGPTRARIDVRREGDALAVDVQDAGPSEGWRPQPGAGHGLDALRERVAVLGGTLDAEPAGPGFRLTARIPDRGPA